MSPAGATKPLASLKDLMLHGDFAGVRLGSSQHDVLRLLGPPDGMASPDGARGSRLWAYGNIEFHFEPDRLSVWLIHTDHFHRELPADAGPTIGLDSWVLRPLLTLHEFRSTLDGIGAAYRVGPDPAKNDGGLRVSLAASRCEVLFIDERHWEDGCYPKRPPRQNSGTVRHFLCGFSVVAPP